MSETKLVTVRVPLEYINSLTEISGRPLATTINIAIKHFVEVQDFVSFVSFADESLFISVSTAAKALHVSKVTIRNMCRDKRLKAIKPAKDWMIFSSEIKAALRPNVIHLES